MILTLVLLAALHTPEECLGKQFTAEYQGKTYGFQYADCRDEFLTDPERFSQLYDALLEMQEAGMKVEAPKAAKSGASLVPS